MTVIRKGLSKGGVPAKDSPGMEKVTKPSIPRQPMTGQLRKKRRRKKKPGPGFIPGSSPIR